jgi:hypothetical protein
MTPYLLLYGVGISLDVVMINAFKEYLLRGSVKSTYVPFYLKWISACYQLLDIDPSSRLTVDQKKQFLAHRLD